MNLRLFVALEPSDLVRRRLGALQAALRRAAGRAAGEVRWADPATTHLTLQFLGAVLEERLPSVREAVAAAAAEGAPLHLQVSGTGGFPGTRRARVVWAGLGGDLAPLAALVAALARRLEPLGFPPEPRPFSPHLTLGRARDPRGVAGLASALAHAGEGAPPAPWRATEVVLFRSHLSPAGARHEPLLRAALGGGESPSPG